MLGTSFVSALRWLLWTVSAQAAYELRALLTRTEEFFRGFPWRLRWSKPAVHEYTTNVSVAGESGIITRISFVESRLFTQR